MAQACGTDPANQARVGGRQQMGLLLSNFRFPTQFHEHKDHRADGN